MVEVQTPQGAFEFLSLTEQG